MALVMAAVMQPGRTADVAPGMADTPLMMHHPVPGHRQAMPPDGGREVAKFPLPMRTRIFGNMHDSHPGKEPCRFVPPGWTLTHRADATEGTAR
jgi:hypothetical protein